MQIMQIMQICYFKSVAQGLALTEAFKVPYSTANPKMKKTICSRNI
jgi:hypothetical protein